MKTFCIECKNDFELSQNMITEKYIGAMLTETYFSCPRCNHKYLVCIENAKIRRIKAEIARLNPLTKGQHEELTQMLRQEMDILNGKV